MGTPKSGTTYLQTLLWQNRTELASQGLLLPGQRIRDHFYAASLICERQEVLDLLDDRERATWDRLLTESRGWAEDVLISHELFAPASSEQAASAIRALQGTAEQVHLIITARDLARQLRSDWQQNVKQGRTETLIRFWESVRDDPQDEWWLYHDLPRLMDRWAPDLPPERVHLVVLPPDSGGSPEWLWRAVCDLVGVASAGLETRTDRRNESLGVVQVETMRRVQAALPETSRGLEMRRLTKDFFATRVLAHTRPETPFVLPTAAHLWAGARGKEMMEELGQRGYHVVGDLRDLLPASAPPAGRTPDSVGDTEVADVAVQALARFLALELRRRKDEGRPPRRPKSGAEAPGGWQQTVARLRYIRRTMMRKIARSAT